MREHDAELPEDRRCWGGLVGSRSRSGLQRARRMIRGSHVAAPGTDKPNDDPEARAGRPSGTPVASRSIGRWADQQRGDQCARGRAALKHAVTQPAVLGGSRLAITRRPQGQLNASPTPSVARVHLSALAL